jgi:hypothetical protein
MVLLISVNVFMFYGAGICVKSQKTWFLREWMLKIWTRKTCHCVVLCQEACVQYTHLIINLPFHLQLYPVSTCFRVGELRTLAAFSELQSPHNSPDWSSVLKCSLREQPWQIMFFRWVVLISGTSLLVLINVGTIRRRHRACRSCWCFTELQSQFIQLERCRCLLLSLTFINRWAWECFSRAGEAWNTRSPGEFATFAFREIPGWYSADTWVIVLLYHGMILGRVFTLWNLQE